MTVKPFEDNFFYYDKAGEIRTPQLICKLTEPPFIVVFFPKNKDAVSTSHHFTKRVVYLS